MEEGVWACSDSATILEMVPIRKLVVGRRIQDSFTEATDGYLHDRPVED